MTASSSTPLRSARPRKSLGQYFLVDSRILDRIVTAAGLVSHDLVVEIGPGKGALTRRLLAEAGHVISVELDRQLAASLSTRLGNPANLCVINDDARSVDLARFTGPESSYKVVANLPYYAANPIVRRFLESDTPPTRMVVMVQREVAESMTARPGQMTILSVATQYFAQARLVCSVPASSFRPSPKVTSAVVCLDRLDCPAVNVSSVESFFQVVRAGFSAPRKQLKNSLGQGLGMKAGAASLVLEEAQIDGARRAETLELKEWEAVYRAWENSGQLPGKAKESDC